MAIALTRSVYTLSRSWGRPANLNEIEQFTIDLARARKPCVARDETSMQFKRVALLALLVANLLSALPVRADDAPPVSIALFKTAADDASLVDLAAALDPVIGSELSEVAAITVSTRPVIDLWGAQLAIDCVGESAECLSAAAKQAETQGLIAPAVTKDGDAVSVSILYFEPSAGAARTVKRRYAGERIGEQALSGVPGMVTEIFGEPQAPEHRARSTVTVSPATEALPPTAAAPERAQPAGIPIAPIVLGAVGVAFLGTGIAFGVASNASNDAYNEIDVTDLDSAERAVDKQQAAKNQATVANVTLVLGAAAMIGAGVLLYWQLSERKSESKSRVALVPQFGPRQAGLALTGAWNGSL